MRAGNSVSLAVTVAVALTIVAVSCGRGSEDISNPDLSPATPDLSPATTSETQSNPDPSSATRADLSPATRIELQARALSAACFSVSCDTKPVYAYLHAGPDVRAALEDAFGTDVEFLSYQELRDATRSNSTYAYGATLFDVMRRTYLPADGVAAVDIWIGEGFGIGRGTTFLFRWSGAGWEPVTPAEAGVTVTSAVT